MPTDDRDLDAAARETARALFPARDPGGFRPQTSWEDLGALLKALESRGLFLMTNSATKDGRVRRIASFHRDTGTGYPCVGSSEWGWYPALGEAVLLAAHEAVTRPRA